MIRWPTAIFVATTPIDLRGSFDLLAGIVREELGCDPRADAMYLFHNRTRTLVKILWADATGYFVLSKRLDRGTYRIPLAIPADARQVSVSARELTLLLEGIDSKQLRAARRVASPVTRTPHLSATAPSM